MKIQSILWDWNGTLLADVALCVDVLNRLLAQYHYPQRYDTAQYRKIFCFPIRTYYQRAGFDFSKDSFEDLAKSYMDMYIPESDSCLLVPDGKAVLAALQQAGLRQTILSASPLPTLEHQVSARDVRPYFEALLGLGDIYAASKVALGHRYLTESNLDPARTVMVGDSTHDFEVAQALGVGCLLCSNGHQSAEVLKMTGAPVFGSLAEICSEIL